MATSPAPQPQSQPLFWGQSLRTTLRRLATATAAVVGLSAMAGGAAGSTPAMADGVYLYGESPVANQIGAVYFVFEARDGQLSGALYQPSSSFDCVRGTVGMADLDLVVTDAYDQSESNYSIALVSSAAIATANGGAGVTQLEGLHEIATLSELDRQLLATCTAR